MKYSHSSISTFISCQRLFKYIYVDGKHLKPTDDMVFGELVHKVLCDASNMPSEELFPELKEKFEIKSWENYFYQVKKDIDRLLVNYDVVYRELPIETDDFCGIIDLVLRNKENNRILLIDYKTACKPRTLPELLYDEQLYLYSYLYNYKFGESLSNIDIGIISIPKGELEKPNVLKNKTLSKSKSQNTNLELYKEAIKENGLIEADYADFLSELENKHYVEIITTPLRLSIYHKVIENTNNVIKMIEYAIKNNIFIEDRSYRHLSCSCIEFAKTEGEFYE